MIRILLSLLTLLVALPVLADQMPANAFTYEGYFQLPSALGFGAQSISYVPDCMGETDPSPSTYPGCLISTLKAIPKSDVAAGRVMLIDIPDPTPTGTNEAATVLSEWRVTDDIPRSNGYASGLGRHEFVMYYDYGASPCRIVWSYYLEYGNSPADPDLVFGYSDCDEVTPDAQGMWRMDSEGDSDVTNSDPFRSTKWIYDITKIPLGVATDHFSGDRMLLGPGKSFGSRGSSLGPSIGVRPWTFPTDSGGWDDFVPIVYYNSSIGYSRWDVPSLFRGATDTQASFVSAQSGQDVIRITDGGTDYEAFFTVGSRSVTQSDQYPLNDINAKPTEPPWDVGSDTYQSPGVYGWPDPDVVPVEWYGVEVFQGDYGASERTLAQQPSFSDDCTTTNCGEGANSDFKRMPIDSNLISTCSHGTGPSSQAQNTFLYLYDVDELADMYAGTSGNDPEDLQPYAEINVTVDLSNDGWDLRDSCAQIGRQKGVTVDRESDSDVAYIFFSHDGEVNGTQPPYSAGSQMAISVYSVDPETGVEPPIESDDNIADGASADGGKIE